MKVELDAPDWCEQKYTIGNICSRLSHVYICKKNHVATNVCAPTLESIEWIPLEYQRKVIKGAKRRRHSVEISTLAEKLDIEEERLNNILHTNTTLRHDILQLDTDDSIKTLLYNKYTTMSSSSSSSHNSENTHNWLKLAVKLPFNKNIPPLIKSSDSLSNRQSYFKNIQDKLNENIYGLQDVKDKIINFIGKKITSPSSKCGILALCGPQGVGKTSLVRSGLSQAYNVPFYQINCGGMSDGNILVGHSETYSSAKPGMIAEIMMSAQCNNPIIYLDEIDKISKNKKEISSIFMQILDETQHNTFHDNYFANIPIDLSKVMFVVSFNDPSLIDPILLDRLNVIDINNPSTAEKIDIVIKCILPNIGKDISIKVNITPTPTTSEYKKIVKKQKISNVNPIVLISQEIVEYIVRKIDVDSCIGLRSIKQTFDNILMTINKKLLVESIKLVDSVFEITRSFIDEYFKLENSESINPSISMMYI